MGIGAGGGGATSVKPEGYFGVTHQFLLGTQQEIHAGTQHPTPMNLAGGLIDELMHPQPWIAGTGSAPDNPYLQAVNEPTDPDGIYTSILLQASEGLTRALDIDNETDWGTTFDKALTKVSGNFDPRDPDPDLHTASTGILAKALAEVQNVTDTLLANSDTAVSTELDTIITKATSISATIIDNAIDRALSVMDSNPQQELVDAFEERETKRYYKTLNRFRGQMSMINAVNSSAFVIGMAVRENELNQRVSEYDAQLSSDLYRQTIGLYVSAHQGMTTIYDSMVKFLNTEQSDNYKKLFLAHLQGLLQSRLLSDDAKYRHYVQAVSTMTASKLQAKAVDMQAVGTVIEADRLKYVMEREYKQDLIEYEVEEKNFYLERYQYGANVLAAGTGGTVSTKHGISKSASAIGGAFAGASLGLQGAQAGMFAGAPGMLIGGAIGGIAGLLSGE